MAAAKFRLLGAEGTEQRRWRVHVQSRERGRVDQRRAVPHLAPVPGDVRGAVPSGSSTRSDRFEQFAAPPGIEGFAPLRHQSAHPPEDHRRGGAVAFGLVDDPGEHHQRIAPSPW